MLKKIAGDGIPVITMTELEFQRIAFMDPPREGEPDFWKKSAMYTEAQCDAGLWLHAKDCRMAAGKLGQFLNLRGADPTLETIRALKTELETRADKIDAVLARNELVETRAAMRITPLKVD
jgi:hypothetical protein